MDSQEPNLYRHVPDPNVLVDVYGFSYKVPNSAKAVRDFVNRNGGSGVAGLPSPPFHPRGTGRPFLHRPDRATGRRPLPTHDANGNAIIYHEYDIKIDPRVRGTGSDRGGHGIVMGSDGSNYYTNNHYGTFHQF